MSVERKARRMRAQAESKARHKGWVRRHGHRMVDGQWMAIGKLWTRGLK